MFGTVSDEMLRKEWSQRESSRLVESTLEKVSERSELTSLEFRRLVSFVYAEERKLRRQALLAGMIIMGNGRVIRRKNHVDMTGKTAA